MDEPLGKIVRWANRGNLQQFYSELIARLAPHGYEALMENDTITCYRVEKNGGFLGIGARTERTPVLVLRKVEALVEPDDHPRDEAFLTVLAGLLQDH